MSERAVFRLEHIKQSIGYIHEALDGKTLDQIAADPITRAAFERWLEIISEASRHLPMEWKSTFGRKVPWRQVADLGNQLRHGYDGADLSTLWSIYRDDLNPLEAAIDAMLAAHGPEMRK